MKNIYFTEDFIQDIANEENSIELYKYKLSPYLRDSDTGKYIHPITKLPIVSLSQIDKDFMDNSNPSPQVGSYTFEAVYDSSKGEFKMYLSSLLNIDAGIKLDDEQKSYRILYVLYSSSLSMIDPNISGGTASVGTEDKIAFILYDRTSNLGQELRLDPLYLSRHRNLITINIPFKCEVITKKDTDTMHLEGTGVDSNYANFFTISSDSSKSDSTYLDKESYMRYYYNNLSSNDPYYGGVTINKFGLRSY